MKQSQFQTLISLFKSSINYKRINLFSFLMLFITISSFSQQEIQLGGISKPYLWLKPKKVLEKVTWQNLGNISPKVTEISQKGDLFNYNPSIIFDGKQDKLQISLSAETEKHQTIFIVYKTNEIDNEQFLWNTSDSKNTITLATNKRLVDLKSYNYRSYNKKIGSQQANIHFYQHHKENTANNDFILSVGTKPKVENLPPTPFKGDLSEIIVYDRVLSSFETQKIASYLAIKYGISLSQFETKNYLNSQGEIIWEASKHKGFENDITAVGRDDKNALLQTKSSNMANEDLLTFEMKSKLNKIPDNYFVFWSDNSKDFVLRRQEYGYPFGISRQWKLDFQTKEDIILDWTFDPSIIKGAFKPDDYYWLLLDYSGKGTYEEDSVEYVKLASTTSKEKIKLSDFNWDKQLTSKTDFTIKVAPAMFAQVWIDQPTCGSLTSGKLKYEIHGGTAPFTVSLYQSNTDNLLKKWQQNTKTTQDISITSGAYDYIVRDSKGAEYKETLYVTDKNATMPKLDSFYFIKKGETITLDASAELPEGAYKYEWYLENNYICDTKTIPISQAGYYELRLTNNQDCKSIKKIVVEVEENGQIISDGNIVLYPNPTTDGHFSIALNFPQETYTKVTIRNPLGVTLKETELFDIKNYIYQDDIITSTGIYLVTISTYSETKTYKLLVK